MAKKILFGRDAREKLTLGAKIITDAVTTTLGPRGRNVALYRKWGAPRILHDGVSVAKEIEHEDQFINMGIQLVKDAAAKTNDQAGDGTTTSTLLTYAILSEGMKNIAAGANPMRLKKGIDEAVDVVVKEIKEKAKKVEGHESVKQVATLSAQNEKIGTLIADAVEKVGKDGLITVDEGRSLDIELEVKDGFEFDGGYVSPYFITDAEKLVAEMKDAYVVITDKHISSNAELVPFLEKFAQRAPGSWLLFVADIVDGEALATIIMNRLRGTLNIVVVKAPAFGERRKDMLEDIALLTGGTVIAHDLGKKLNDVEMEDLGRADSVRVTKDTTQIVGGKGQKEDVETRLAQLKNQLKDADSEYAREILTGRIAKLSGGVAVISVGATTEVEMKERKERVYDAVAATRAALEKGIVPGGGLTFLQTREKIREMKSEDQEVQLGYNIVYNALSAPIRKLAENCGVDAGEIIHEINTKNDPNYGFNAETMSYGDLLEQGVVDPVKVLISALQNSASIASMMLTNDVLVAPPKEEEK